MAKNQMINISFGKFSMKLRRKTFIKVIFMILLTVYFIFCFSFDYRVGDNFRCSSERVELKAENK